MLLIDVAFSRRGSTTQRKLEKFIFAGGGHSGSQAVYFRGIKGSVLPYVRCIHTHTHTIFESSQ